MNQHPHIEIITAWYNGASVEVENRGNWYPVDDYKSCDAENTPDFAPNVKYRIKPKTFTLALSEEQMETLNLAIADYIDRNGVDDSIDALKAKIREAEKNA